MVSLNPVKVQYHARMFDFYCIKICYKWVEFWKNCILPQGELGCPKGIILSQKYPARRNNACFGNLKRA